MSRRDERIAEINREINRLAQTISHRSYEQDVVDKANRRIEQLVDENHRIMRRGR